MVSLAAVTAFDPVHVLVLVLTSLFLSFLFLSSDHKSGLVCEQHILYSVGDVLVE